MQDLGALIATLNTLKVGELEAVRAQLLDVRTELERRDLAELVSKLDECLAALGSGDLKNFRRLKETIVSRLGHLR
jgi:galactokinase/mevalonate kinase-like predicted kinase